MTTKPLTTEEIERLAHFMAIEKKNDGNYWIFNGIHWKIFNPETNWNDTHAVLDKVMEDTTLFSLVINQFDHESLSHRYIAFIKADQTTLMRAVLDVLPTHS